MRFGVGVGVGVGVVRQLSRSALGSWLFYFLIHGSNKSENRSDRFPIFFAS